jgi:hypothetical protein
MKPEPLLSLNHFTVPTAMINIPLQLYGNVLPENLDDVFPDFKLGWIDARTFSEPLGEKNQTSFGLQDQSVYIDLLEGRN